MFFEHRTFWLPKDLQQPQGYEDAFELDPAGGKAAICDGVASSLFSGRWAAILAKAAVEETPRVRNPEVLEAWLRQQRQRWSASIDESALAWHQKPKLLEGASSTLLWVELSGQDAPEGTARPRRLCGYAIGDCCLFHVRRGGLLQTFPIENSARFEDHPQVLRSVYKRADAFAFEAFETQCHPGDLLVMCTDAVACWTLRQLEAGGTVDWDAYWTLSSSDWQQWILQLRQSHQIRYDDSTVLVLRVSGRQPDTSRKPAATHDALLEKAETSMRGAFKTLKGSVRRGLKGLADSKWLSEDRQE